MSRAKKYFAFFGGDERHPFAHHPLTFGEQTDPYKGYVKKTWGVAGTLLGST